MYGILSERTFSRHFGVFFGFVVAFESLTMAYLSPDCKNCPSRDLPSSDSSEMEAKHLSILRRILKDCYRYLMFWTTREFQERDRSKRTYTNLMTTWPFTIESSCSIPKKKRLLWYLLSHNSGDEMVETIYKYLFDGVYILEENTVSCTYGANLDLGDLTVLVSLLELIEKEYLISSCPSDSSSPTSAATGLPQTPPPLSSSSFSSDDEPEEESSAHMSVPSSPAWTEKCKRRRAESSEDESDEDENGDTPTNSLPMLRENLEKVRRRPVKRRKIYQSS